MALIFDTDKVKLKVTRLSGEFVDSDTFEEEMGGKEFKEKFSEVKPGLWCSEEDEKGVWMNAKVLMVSEGRPPSDRPRDGIEALREETEWACGGRSGIRYPEDNGLEEY